MSKEFIKAINLEQMLNKIEEKNIIIENHDLTKQALLNHSYYTLINGYKRHFLKNNEQDKMIPGTTFDHFLEVYYLDTDLSEMIFKYIIYIEKSLRTRLSNYIALNMGEENSKYLKRSLYENKRGTRADILISIQDTIANCKDDSLTKYFKDNKANIPPWIVAQDLSFNTIIGWLDILPDKDQIEVTKDYFTKTKLYCRYRKNFFYYSLHFLREYRNKIAHGKIHFESKTKHYLHTRSAEHFFNRTIYTKETKNSNPSGKDLFAAISLICGLLLDEKLAYRFKEELLHVFGDYINEKNGEIINHINGKSIYEIFNLPEDTFKRIDNYYESIK